MDRKLRSAALKTITYSKTRSYEAISGYQPCRAGTLNFRLVRHLTQDLRSMISMYYLHVGLCEAPQKKFKEAHK